MFIFGLGERRYQVNSNWAKLPEGVSLNKLSGISVNNEGNILVLQRSNPYLLIFTPDGELVDQWHNAEIADGHYLKVAEDGRVLIVDRDHHRIVILDKTGKVLNIIGDLERPGIQGEPFNHPTDIAINDKGEFFITDGYGNSCVHHFDASGNLIKSWGKPGTGQGEFSTPHSIVIDKKGRLFIADRENNRIQIFNQQGEYLGEIKDLFHPMILAKDSEDFIYVSDQTPRLSMFSPEGELIGRFRTFALYAHGIVVDKNSHIYIAEMIPDGLTKLTYIP